MTPKHLSPGAEPTFSIGELAREYGISLRAIRFYEDQGLLTPERHGQLRVFGKRDRARLAMICRGKRLGFSLKVIKAYLDLYETDKRQVSQMRYLLTQAQERIKILEQQQKDIVLTLDELRAVEKNLTEHLPELERGEITAKELRRIVP